MMRPQRPANNVKRFFAIGLGVLISAAMGMTLSAMAFSSEEDLLEEILAEAGVEGFKNDAKELERLSQTEDFVFENLYLFMFQNVQEGPKEAALKQLGQRLSYSEGEIEQIINGDVSPIVKALGSGATLEAAQDEFGYIAGLYDSELDFQTENRKLVYEALASEIFMNNDLSDSANVDILYDLDLINYLMFGEYIEYPDRSGTEEVNLASVFGDDSEDWVDEVAALDYEADYEVELAAEAAGTALVDPYACYEDEDLRIALEEFENSEDGGGSDGGGGSSSGSSGDSGSGGGGGSGSDGSSGGTSDSEADEDEGEGETQTIEDVVNSIVGVKGDWTRSLPCTEVFCIVVNLVPNTEDPEVKYEKTDNSIASHIAFMNARMEETLSKSLVPSKVTGNYFEDATCKAAGRFVDLDFNVYTIKKPVTLDPGDDIDEIAYDDMAKFQQSLISGNGFPLPGGSKTLKTKIQAEVECEAILGLAALGDVAVELSDALDDCETASNAIDLEIQEVYDEFLYKSSVQGNQTLYEQVSAELSSMLIYFDSFKNSLEATYATEQAPLSSLLSKDYCRN